ncbi:hypothetical protein AJ79_05331 [Helicocarpus griseus UAMH5409]|uniref:Uncharacterized protein n=1 Tax=Helicocarpus griseus UAMH5409 TaxID=1447875 RepID=A0A2B7XP81_9EURO|nr:hypothetical protein AJ79_05331 [Helicocarpus griseus UAMH5409]
MEATTLSNILQKMPVSDQPISDLARPFSDLVADFKNRVLSIAFDDSESLAKEILALCDHIRNIDLFYLGIYIEDQPTGPAIVRPVTKDIVQQREREAERHIQKQKERKERETLRPLKKNKMEIGSSGNVQVCGV